VIEFAQLNEGVFWTTVAFLGLVVILAIAYGIIERRDRR
jgi:hypothetical protein